MFKSYKVFLMIIIISSFTLAQTVNKYDIYLSGGAGIPLSPKNFSDNWNLGYNIGGGWGMNLTPDLSVILSVDYNSFAANMSKLFPTDSVNKYALLITKSNSNASSLHYDLTGYSINIFSVSLNAKYQLMTGPVIPYLVIGGGISNMSYSNIQINAYYFGEEQSVTTSSGKPVQNSAFISGGAGIEFQLSETVNLFLEGKYCMGFTSGGSTSYVPVKGGFSIGF